jgi:hypothetical protein
MRHRDPLDDPPAARPDDNGPPVTLANMVFANGYIKS